MNPNQLMRAIFSLLPLSILLVLAGCTKETEEFTTESVNNYFPLQTGKYIVYQLDSTVFPQSGRKEEVHVYQEKLEVTAQLADNEGRTTFRLDRFVRDSAGNNTWTNAGAIFVTPLEKQIEVVSDNLRVLRLIAPLTEGNTWKAFRYISSGTTDNPEGPYQSLFEFNDDNHIHLNDWELTYGAQNETITLNNQTIDSVVTVNGPDEAANAPVTDKNSFGSRTYVVDKYAKNIGLIYQELVMWEYQPNPNGTPFKVGFGVKRSMIDHN